MLKGKLKLPEKARKVFPDRLGSLVVGFDDKEDETGGSDSIFDLGKELETFQPNGFGSERESDNECTSDGFHDDQKVDKESEFRVRQRVEKESNGSISALEFIAADEKRSDFEFELSQPEINLEKLQRLADTGIPDGGGLRATIWKLLLGYIPSSRDLWEKELTENRLKYATLKEELLLYPSEFTRRKDGASSSNEQLPHPDHDADGLLKRHEISKEDDHPLSLGKASVWHKYFEHSEITEQIDRDLRRTHPDMKFFSGDSSTSRKNREAMRNILLLFSKLNPAIRYVQGMNEVLAPILYVFSIDTNEKNVENAEADSFFCFVRLLGDSVDHFCQELDNSSGGILSTISRLMEILKANDEELWRHLEFTSKVEPLNYAFRWITLLLTQEFNFQTIMRIWDSFLSNPFGVQDMLLRVCCAMLLCIKSKLLSGDFVANLKLLQHYPPDVSIEHLLQVARDISPDTSSYRLSLL